MQTITLLFTRRRFNPISWLIRWAIPRSRFALALSSHCIIDAGDKLYEATMLHGVREVGRATALAGQTVVLQRAYRVRNAAAGVGWVKTQLCRYKAQAPSWLPDWAQRLYCAAALVLNSNYDWPGALGLGLSPYRDWAAEGFWFCYELGAGCLVAAGRDDFADTGHITEASLLMIKP